MEVRPKRSWREIYVGTLLFISGTVVLILLAASWIGRESGVQDDTITLNRSELFADVRTLITIVICFAGGAGLLRIRKIGWSLSLAMLVLFLALTYAGWLWVINSTFDISYILVPLATTLILLGIILLLLPYTRSKFGVARREFLLFFITLAVLGVVYFVLQ